MHKVRLQKGFSLSELLTVVAVMALLIGISVPASKALMDSVHSSAGLRTMVASSLTTARAIAIQEQKYAGVRFQSDTDGNQYMIFIINDDSAAPTMAQISMDPDITGTGLANGFRAIKGHEPIKLPGDGRLMDMTVRYCGTRDTGNPDAEDPRGYVLGSDGDGTDDISVPVSLKYPIEYMDATTFSIVFSPAGKLVTHEVRVRNRHGRINSSSYTSVDKTFNINTVVEADKALLYQDDYPDSADELGLGQEYSRKSFVFFDNRRFNSYLETGDLVSLWTNYLGFLEETYVNPYTGEIVGGQVE